KEGDKEAAERREQDPAEDQHVAPAARPVALAPPFPSSGHQSKAAGRRVAEEQDPSTGMRMGRAVRAAGELQEGLVEIVKRGRSHPPELARVPSREVEHQRNEE